MIQLQQWFKDHIPNNDMLWKTSMTKQIIFVRDQLPHAFPLYQADDLKNLRVATFVISTHISKSIVLPVYFMVWNGFNFIMRDNFYDWKVSVASPNHIDIDFEKYQLFNPKERIHHVYCEGFAQEWIYGPYDKNSGKFTISIQNNYELYCFFKILTRNF